MDEGVIEGGEDTGDAEDEFTCGGDIRNFFEHPIGGGEGLLTFSDLGAERDVLGGGALDLLLGRHDGEAWIVFL